MKWEDLLGPLIPVTYVLMLIAEQFVPARKFPPVRRWVWIGALFTSILIGLALLIATTAVYILGRNRMRTGAEGFSSAQGQG